MNDPIGGFAALSSFLSPVASLSAGALKGRAYRGTLPFSVHRIGRTVIFDREEVMRWMANATPHSLSGKSHLIPGGHVAPASTTEPDFSG